jgi:flagellar biosynthesis protein FlhB
MEGRMTDVNGNTVRLEAVHKIIITAIAIVTFFASTVGGYFVSRSMTDYRLGETEIRMTKNEARTEQMEQYGHPDHERRITKLEARADSADKDISAIKSQLDVAVAILQRIEQRLDDKR